MIKFEVMIDLQGHLEVATTSEGNKTFFVVGKGGLEDIQTHVHCPSRRSSIGPLPLVRSVALAL